MEDLQAALRAHADGTRMAIKVVPGSSRDRIVGMLGDRLKVAVSAAPEDGKANKAVCALLAKHLEISKRDVAVVRGQSDPIKTIQVDGTKPDQIIEQLRGI